MGKINTIRKAGGSMLLMMLVVLCFVLLPMMILFSQFALYQNDKTRAQTVVEAAGLVAANDLSRLIINDENFGYVSLSNYPPIGKGTCAQDGEPLPVLGINTLVGTVRQNTIIASELNNPTMACLADRDRSALDETIKKLNQHLQKTLAEGTSGRDIQGEKVEPGTAVRAFLKAHLPSDLTLQSVKMTCGWLEGGSDSTINIPSPPRLAQLRPGADHAGKYTAFIDVPAVGRNFTFAGLGPSSALVNIDKFRPADTKHICSIVKIDVVLKRQNLNQPLAPFGVLMPDTLLQSTCTQPFSMPDSGPSGAMTLRFSSGPVGGLQSWHDFLTGAFSDSQITTYDVVNGDYPTVQGSQMIAATPAITPTTSRQFAEHFYYWLRNGHNRPHIDAVMEMINQPFYSGPAQIYAYEFSPDGKISRRIIARDPFPIGVTADSQAQTVIDTTIQGGISPIIIFRDDVKNLGTLSGGTHAGQPLAGCPLNWCELPEYGGDEQVAAALGKGRQGTRLSLVDATAAALPQNAINDPNLAIFQNMDGKTLFHQPRRSFYSGGLALDIEIGGTNGGVGPTTASASSPPQSVPDTSACAPLKVPLPPILDIPNKRYIFANRKI